MDTQDTVFAGEPDSEDVKVEMMEALGGSDIIKALQDRVLRIQIGQDDPPDWFERTGFDSGIVRVEAEDGETLEYKCIAATSATMEALDRAIDRNELLCEQNAVIETIAEIPEQHVLRRPTKIGNKKFDAGHYWPNLWEMYDEHPKLARELLGKHFGGKLYTMIKMATMWLSKVTMSDIAGMDPEEGDDKRPPV